MTLQDYEWAAGFNNAGSLVNIEIDVAQFQNIPFSVQGRGAFDPGIVRPNAAFGRYTTGVQGFLWLFSLMSETQYDYIQSTYTTGGDSYSGEMTVRTLVTGTTFANYNCTLWLPKKPELTRVSNGYSDVPFRFVNAVAI